MADETNDGKPSKKQSKKTVEQLEQELLEAKAQLSDAKPDIVVKAKPYTKDEIADLHKGGHHIGVPGQKLSEGHDTADLQKWDLWQCELALKDIGKLPETGEPWSVPEMITPMKIATKGKSGNDKSFQWENKQIDFRQRGANNQIFYNFPEGSVEAGKKYECHYWVELTRGIGGKDNKHVRMVVKELPRMTGAPTDPNKWGRG